MRLFTPSDGPPWLPGFAASILSAFKSIMDAPFRLWQAATADLPAAADYTGGMVWNQTSSIVTWSNGSAWVQPSLSTHTHTLSGDVTGTVTGAVTLATVNANVGTFGSATQSLTLTANAKGLITAVSAQTVTPAVGSITGLGAGVGAALAVAVGSAGAFVTFNGAGGTPSSLTLTNATGLTVAGGGTGRATSTTAYGLIAAGTTATGAHQTLPAGATTEILVGGGASALPAWTTATGTGAPARAGSPTFTGTANFAGIASSSRAEIGGGVRATGFDFAGTSGLGGELLASGGVVNLNSFNRTSSAFAVLNIQASQISLNPGGTVTITLDATFGNFLNDAAASAGGVPVKGLYRNGSVLMVRVV